MWSGPGSNIKRYLEEAGITQAYLSRETGIDAAKLCLALNGNRQLSIEEYLLICKTIGVDTNFFIDTELQGKKDKTEIVLEKILTEMVSIRKELQTICHNLEPVNTEIKLLPGEIAQRKSDDILPKDHSKRHFNRCIGSLY